MSKRTQIREKRRRARQRQRLMIISGIIGAALIIVAILILPGIRPVGDILLPNPIDHPLANGTAMGDPNAPVVIEEYSDFLCSFCRRFAFETEPDLIEEYISKGIVYFIYKNYPLQPDSFPIAEAGLCAAEQDMFWEYHDILFANQDEHNVQAYSTRRLEAYAETIDLEMDQFRSCTGSNRYRADVEQSQLDGVNAGVESTPTFFVNGKIIEGAQPFSVFQEAIEAALIEG